MRRSTWRPTASSTPRCATPPSCTSEGLALEEVVEAVNAGFREGEEQAAEAGHADPGRRPAHRDAARRPRTEIAELAVRYRDQGVVGFDIAGAEAGFPPTRHLDAFEYLRRENAHFTIHAGEAFGLPTIWEAIQWCGADRLGHGVRIVDDITVGDKAFGDDVAAAVVADTDDVHLGRLAAYVRDKRIPLEMCPSSNIQTGAAESVAEHPIALLEAAALPGHRQHRQPADERHVDDPRDAAARRGRGLDLDDLRWVTVNAMKSAFLPFDERLAIIEDVVKPGYAALGRPSRRED